MTPTYETPIYFGHAKIIEVSDAGIDSFTDLLEVAYLVKSGIFLSVTEQLLQQVLTDRSTPNEIAK